MPRTEARNPRPLGARAKNALNAINQTMTWLIENNDPDTEEATKYLESVEEKLSKFVQRKKRKQFIRNPKQP